jgi:hypothetical protein
MGRAMQVFSYTLLVAFSTCGVWAQQLPLTIGALPGAGKAPDGPPSANSAVATAPNPPRVSCKGNQLTITADNSTLGSVLTAIQACIGLQIEVPDGSSGERSYLHLGPGPAREIIESLLRSTELNYVIQTSANAPEKILSILVMARSKDIQDGNEASDASFAASASMTPARRAWLASRNAGRLPVTPRSDERSDMETEAVAPVAAEEVPRDGRLAVVGADASDAKAQAKEVENPLATAAVPDTIAASDPIPAPTSSGPNQNLPADKELQDKISNMQQLFDQRKKLITNPSAPQE